MDELERRQHQPEDRRQRLADLVGRRRQILLQVVGVVVYRLFELGQGPLEVGEEEVRHPLAEILQGQPEAAHLEHNAADFFELVFQLFGGLHSQRLPAKLDNCCANSGDSQRSCRLAPITSSERLTASAFSRVVHIVLASF